MAHLSTLIDELYAQMVKGRKEDCSNALALTYPYARLAECANMALVRQ